MKIVRTEWVWSIIDSITGIIIVGGFSSREAAVMALQDILEEKNGSQDYCRFIR